MKVARIIKLGPPDVTVVESIDIRLSVEQELFIRFRAEVVCRRR